MTSTALPVHGPELAAGCTQDSQHPPMFLDGFSASALGSFFICVPSSCLPTQHPLAWERWVMELGAILPLPLWLMYLPSEMLLAQQGHG